MASLDDVFSAFCCGQSPPPPPISLSKSRFPLPVAVAPPLVAAVEADPADEEARPGILFLLLRFLDLLLEAK